MVQVIVRGFDILEFVAKRDGHSVTLTEIGQALELNQSTAANIIKTLVYKGYLEHIGKKKGYRLGPAAYQLTHDIAYGQELITASQEIMEGLTARLNESCILGVLRNNKRFTLNVVNSKQEIQIQVRSERNVYETASGRLLIAYLSPKDVERFVELNGLPEEKLWPGASTLDSLKVQLTAIRHAGIVHTHLQDRHVKGYAVPVFSKGAMVAGLSVFLPEFRSNADKEREIVKALTAAAMQISSRLS